MHSNKAEIFTRLKQEIQSAALNRQDNDNIYIFLKENKSPGGKYNLLIFDGGSSAKKSYYRFHERNGMFFINLNGKDYEMILPDEVSDEEPFNFSIKDTEGNLIHFENYI